VLKKLQEKFADASTAYAAKHAIDRDPDWYILKLQEEVGELTQAWNNATGRGRNRQASKEELRRAIADETADIFGHVLLFAHRNDIDLVSAIERKWKFRPGL
jgi:NTP pyrophosphatase (non-canonical NTP hydrolase)